MPLDLVFLPLKFENNLIPQLVYIKPLPGYYTSVGDKHAGVFFFDDFTIRNEGKTGLLEIM